MVLFVAVSIISGIGVVSVFDSDTVFKLSLVSVGSVDVVWGSGVAGALHN